MPLDTKIIHATTQPCPVCGKGDIVPVLYNEWLESKHKKWVADHPNCIPLTPEEEEELPPDPMRD